MHKAACPVILSSLAIVVLTLSGIVGCESSSEESAATALAISPTSITLDASTTNTVTFTVSGGTSNYAWSVNDASLGSLIDSGDTAIYTSTTNTGNNYITVTDGSNGVVTATIIQQ